MQVVPYSIETIERREGGDIGQNIDGSVEALSNVQDCEWNETGTMRVNCPCEGLAKSINS